MNLGKVLSEDNKFLYKKKLSKLIIITKKLNIYKNYI